MIRSKFFAKNTWLSRAHLVALPLLTVLLSLPLAFAASASSFQDGEGAVEYGDSSGPATPTLPGKVTSPSSGDGQMAPKSFQPKTGRHAAEKYMGQTPGRDSNSDSETAHRGHTKDASKSGGETHFLALHAGLYVSDDAYKWGANEKTAHPGNYNVGLTYRLGEWVDAMDLNFRLDFSEYSLMEGVSSKLSFVPLITFPDVRSRFPLYLGVGAGLGFFMHQIDNESALAFEYQVMGGVRIFDVFPNSGVNNGFFLEGGIKNHVLVLTDGQFNGPFVALGSFFLF